MASVFESNCRNILDYVFETEFITIRPDWLRNPETGKNLELDLYNEKLKLAFECDGQYHDFPSQAHRDKIKDNLCKQCGVLLIRIPYIPGGYLVDHIQQILTKNKRNLSKIWHKISRRVQELSGNSLLFYQLAACSTEDDASTAPSGLRPSLAGRFCDFGESAIMPLNLAAESIDDVIILKDNVAESNDGFLNGAF
jgi:hypothetical protein